MMSVRRREGRTTAGDDDPYVILGVSRQATDATIAAAYRDLARRYHPDLAGERATPMMIRINAAFDAIRTAKRRLEFASEDGWSAGPAAPADAAPAPRRTSARRPSATGSPPPRTAPAADAGQRDRPQWQAARDGTGGAGPPPGRPSGSVLRFGRHIGWSIGEIARVDPGYLEWLVQRREGLPYRQEIDAALERVGYRGRAP